MLEISNTTAIHILPFFIRISTDSVWVLTRNLASMVLLPTSGLKSGPVLRDRCRTTRSPIILSRILFASSSKQIGRYVERVLSGFGRTNFVSFHTWGKMPVRRHSVNIYLNGSASSFNKSARAFPGTSSGSSVLFFTRILLTAPTSSFSVTSTSPSSFSSTAPRFGSRGCCRLCRGEDFVGGEQGPQHLLQETEVQ